MNPLLGTATVKLSELIPWLTDDDVEQAGPDPTIISRSMSLLGTEVPQRWGDQRYGQAWVKV